MEIKKGTSNINRHEFLRKIGFAGSALAAVYFAGHLQSCTNDRVNPAPTNLTLDLTSSENAALKTNGGYVIKDGVVIARSNTGAFIAATLTCSHEGKNQITYQTDHFYCTAHGAKYDNTGKGLNGEGKKGIAVYTTTLNGNILTVTA
ncbi:ubiquinol-cytochrome c reductase iron-sulfur subunit [Dyadobacter subterraneus]|uniref:Rieske 2Fe-2S domain-containing protein n=1 Tax=Dyadobacter subterraneus TaxID=2773304 RepID=A0ABR9WCP5_9BACT|nr:Rieske 2Fe-2S domain-containing protein [Dyadobacter subterraneus]MBE9463259.1 Rieske 2Fe-2S domain-containing protein [Dyadobacter subterraneus]